MQKQQELAPDEMQADNVVFQACEYLAPGVRPPVLESLFRVDIPTHL